MYPEKYKFISIHYVIDNDLRETKRYSASIIDLICEIGGLLKFLIFFSYWLARPFAQLRLKALVTNRLFHLSRGNQIFLT